MKFKAYLSAILFVAAVANVKGQSPAAVERDLLAQLKMASQSGNYSGTYDEEKLNAANKKITEILVSRCKTTECLKYAFPKLKGMMFIATSPDVKLRIYSWDMESGGTMHDFASVYQFQGKSGVRTWTAEDESEGAGGFYTQIFQVTSKNGPIYVATSTFMASSSLNGQSIDAIRINGDQLDLKPKVIKTASGLTNSIGFAYDFFTVVDHPERPIKLIFFDAAKQTFRFPVVIEDDKTPQGRVTNKYITYRFDGTYFVKVS